MNKVGRKSKLTRDKVNDIIYLFKTERNTAGYIKYADIHSYAQELVEQGRLDTQTSDSFWRKKGRLGCEMVDQANQVFTHNLSPTSEEELSIPNIENLINKYFNNKKALIDSLNPLMLQLIDSKNRENQLLKKLQDHQQKVADQKEKNNKLIEKQEQLQSFIFHLYRYISVENNDSTKELITIAMEDLFHNPPSFILQEKNNSTVKAKVPSVAKVISIKKPNKISDLFKGKLD